MLTSTIRERTVRDVSGSGPGAACPTCGSDTVNVQGLRACAACAWTGRPEETGRS